jgi:hypothetical protein
MHGCTISPKVPFLVSTLVCTEALCAPLLNIACLTNIYLVGVRISWPAERSIQPHHRPGCLPPSFVNR